MRSYTLSSFRKKSPCVCALGCFDGVHIGHVALIEEAKNIAHALKLSSLVWSFREPPKNFFSKVPVPILTTPEEKREIIRSLGVDIYVGIPFETKIASFTAEEFFKKILIDKIGAAHIVCGFNYRFGRGGSGDTALLEKLCGEYGIGLSIIPPVVVDGVTVSSSTIRSYLIDGRLDAAKALLGRPYSLRAKVVNGQHLGRTLGFPTTNQSFSLGKLAPKNGVYLSRISFAGKQKYGITNTGFRPTVNGDTLCSETHIFNFNGNLYEKILTVEFLEFLREEKKFESLDELSMQVHSDMEIAKSIIYKKYKHS